MKLKLVHSKTKEEKEIDIDYPLIACHFRIYKDYVFPEETKELLDESMLWAWENGWRGYIDYE